MNYSFVMRDGRHGIRSTSRGPPYVTSPLIYIVRIASFCMSTLAAPGNQQKLLANVTCVSVESAHVHAPSW
jgi:hypothetical protein